MQLKWLIGWWCGMLVRLYNTPNIQFTGATIVEIWDVYAVSSFFNHFLMVVLILRGNNCRPGSFSFVTRLNIQNQRDLEKKNEIYNTH